MRVYLKYRANVVSNFSYIFDDFGVFYWFPQDNNSLLVLIGNIEVNYIVLDFFSII